MPKVNPKDMKPQVYKDPRPAETFMPYHRTARRSVGHAEVWLRIAA